MDAELSYIDSNGRPLLQPSIAGFLDLLGFSQQVMASPSRDESQRLLNQIVLGIEDSRKAVRTAMLNEGLATPAGWATKFFSDNLVVGCPVDGSLASIGFIAQFVIRCVQQYQLRMALNGLFVRGALTHGLLSITDEIIFGAALIDCYQHESKAAVVPRVLLTEVLSSALLAPVGNDLRGGVDGTSDAICRDVDGYWFVNYLQASVERDRVNWSLIECHKQKVLEVLSRTTRHDVLPKFGWMCRYHNMFCHWHRDDPGYREDARINRSDEQSTIQRFSEFTAGTAVETTPCPEST
jgi:hypothetical protein